jgi:ABC-type transport system involved in multi-copper enzyme maturation permease subunit
LETFWKHDLPEGVDPMVTKELRQSLRRGSFVYPFLTIQLLAVIAVAVEFQLGDVTGNSEFNGMLNMALLFTSGPFWWVASAVCCLFLPLGGLILMGQELDEGNHELLLLTHLNRWKIVIGKFAALWGLCLLTFISLLPYLVVRYLVGGIEWAHELACAATVLGAAAILCAGCIGASAFQRTALRTAVLGLFLGSMAFGSGFPLLLSGMVSGGCGWHYHLTAASAIVCYSVIGLALARSRLRLSMMAYEVNPSALILGLLVFAPFAIGVLTGATLGWGGVVPLLGVAYLAARMDLTPKAPPSIPAPLPNVPSTVS